MKSQQVNFSGFGLENSMIEFLRHIDRLPTLTLLGQTEKQILIEASMPVYWGDYQCVCA